MGVITNIPSLPYNVTTAEGFFDWLVAATPLFWPVMLVVFLLIRWANNITLGASRSFVGATLSTGVIGIIVAVLGWMDPKWMYLFGILFGISLLWRYFESGE